MFQDNWKEEFRISKASNSEGFPGTLGGLRRFYDGGLPYPFQKGGGAVKKVGEEGEEERDARDMGEETSGDGGQAGGEGGGKGGIAGAGRKEGLKRGLFASAPQFLEESDRGREESKEND